VIKSTTNCTFMQKPAFTIFIIAHPSVGKSATYNADHQLLETPTLRPVIGGFASGSQWAISPQNSWRIPLLQAWIRQWGHGWVLLSKSIIGLLKNFKLYCILQCSDVQSVNKYNDDDNNNNNDDNDNSVYYKSFPNSVQARVIGTRWINGSSIGLFQML